MVYNALPPPADIVHHPGREHVAGGPDATWITVRHELGDRYGFGDRAGDPEDLVLGLARHHPHGMEVRDDPEKRLSRAQRTQEWCDARVAARLQHHDPAESRPGVTERAPVQCE